MRPMRSLKQQATNHINLALTSSLAGEWPEQGIGRKGADNDTGTHHASDLVDRSIRSGSDLSSSQAPSLAKAKNCHPVPGQEDDDMSFHVGQLVVCVDDAVFHPTFARPQVKRGRIYTVSGLGPADWTGTIGVTVEGAVVQGSGFFRASRFRPVDERRIDIFRKIAASPRQEVDA